jgi:hypothetical protein
VGKKTGAVLDVANPFAGLQATKAKPAAKKASNPVIYLDEQAFEREFNDFIGLCVVIDELEPIAKQRQIEMIDYFMDKWLDTMWSSKTRPENPRFISRKRDGNGKLSLLEDCAVMFQVQFRADGIAKLVPETLPENTTVQDFIQNQLLQNVGLSKNAAQMFVHPTAGELIVQEVYDLSATLNDLLASDDADKKDGATKLLNYLRSTSSKTATLPCLTPEEQMALLKVKQKIVLREGFFERAHTYCANREQLGKLIRFVTPKLPLSHKNYAISDPKKGKAERLQKLVTHFFTVVEE